MIRDIASLRLHPDAERVPMPDAHDLRALRDSLSENGQQDPIDVTEDDIILDGRCRWSLLRELGATTILTRTVYVPEGQQTRYIVGRAVARRQLTLNQKRALNDLLRGQVIEVHSTKRGDVARIGYSSGERAAALGVGEATVKRWDAETPLVSPNDTTRALPTHAIDKRGRPQPLHRPKSTERVPRRSAPRPAPLRKSRLIPSWSRHFSTWCRSARPEDREFLRRIDRELHAALDRNGIHCEREAAS